MLKWTAGQVVGAVMLVGLGAPLLRVPQVFAQAPAGAAPRQLGTVKSIDGGALTLTTKDGAQIAVAVPATASVLQLPPGSTDLKTATPGAAADIAVGDRVLVTGVPGDSATSLTASRVILMKSNDIAARNAQQQADWQKNGTSGLVHSVEGPDFTVAVGPRMVKVDTTPGTIFRRYADDSVRYEDAKTGTLTQVRTGDQIAVRGPKSDDGATITAQEVVTGTFENLSGALTAVDVSAGTVTLKDLTTKKTVTVRVTANSVLHKLPAGFAGGAGRPGGAAPGAAPAAGTAAAAPPRRPDLSRILPRLPLIAIGDLKPGDAVLLVASQGRSDADAPTAVTLLSGVEQLLSATAPGEKPITLSPWTLGVPEVGGAGGPGGGL